MGKWTSEHYDNVLSSKIKSLVTGAVKRSRLEKAEHTISYEAFVEDLDSGDSFTTSLIELLVKELAERRQRQTAADKHLISDSTCKGLRMLAAPQRTYRPRGLAPRRTINLTDYLSVQPPEEMEVDEDDDGSTESLLDPSGALEGARMNTDLWDAFAGGQPETHPSASPSSTARARARLTTRPSIYRDDLPTPRRFVRSPSSTDHLGTLPSAPSTQPTLPSSLSRRPPPARPRSRVSDFGDFTTRRRSVTRENSSSDVHTPAADDVSIGSSSAPATDARRNSNYNNNGSPWPPRFFPGFRRVEPWSESSSTEVGSGTPPQDGPPAPTSTGSTSLRGPSAFLNLLTGTGAEESLPALPGPRSLTLRAASAFGAEDDAEGETEASQLPSQPTRSLRRGGVPAPEDLMPWHVSIATEEGETGTGTVPPVSDVRHQSPERERELDA